MENIHIFWLKEVKYIKLSIFLNNLQTSIKYMFKKETVVQDTAKCKTS